MSKTLTRKTEVWVVDTETEAQEIIIAATKDGGELMKKVIELKQKKSKGEVVAEHLKVTTQVDFESEWGDSGGLE